MGADMGYSDSLLAPAQHLCSYLLLYCAAEPGKYQPDGRLLPRRTSAPKTMLQGRGKSSTMKKELLEKFSTGKTPQADGLHMSLLRLVFTPKLGAPRPHEPHVPIAAEPAPVPSRIRCSDNREMQAERGKQGIGTRAAQKTKDSH